ncbi:MAG TPA: hypothetical protein VIR62_09685 [Allosphingosinicella sp.]
MAEPLVEHRLRHSGFAGEAVGGPTLRITFVNDGQSLADSRIAEAGQPSALAGSEVAT